MEPKLPLPDRAPELRPTNSVDNREGLPQSARHEMDHGYSMETQEHQSEKVPAAENTSPAVVALPAPATPPIIADPTVTLPQVPDDTPSTANDNEMIEKEWVDKAKKVIAETKDDPYRREQEVNKLQADYLFKRYGRKLGSPQ